MQIFISTAELSMPPGTPRKEANAAIKTQQLPVVTILRKRTR